jgi:hypothetical protein
MAGFFVRRWEEKKKKMAKCLLWLWFS